MLHTSQGEVYVKEKNNVGQTAAMSRRTRVASQDTGEGKGAAVAGRNRHASHFMEGGDAVTNYKKFQKLYHEPRWIYPAALIVWSIAFLLGCCL
jgi:hypothetical protein